MDELKIEYYFKDIQNFTCKEIFEGCTYPWEVLVKTKTFLKEYLTKLEPVGADEGQARRPAPTFPP